MKKRATTLVALFAAAGLALAGCADADDATTNTDGGAEGGEGGTVTIGVFNGWDEGIATSELWRAALEDEGYDVKLEYVDAAPVFAGLAEGDLDFTTDVWLPVTHESYLDQFGDQIEELGTWFDAAKLTIAVNEDADIDSLEELADKADMFGNKIVGIESGAGLTKATEDHVIPDYGLEGMEFATSSTVAMLTELKAATDADEDIAVTLWEPHWAYSAFPIKNLDDPEGSLGDAETISIYSRDGFSDDEPKVAEWLSNFEMSPDLLYDLEDKMFNENDTDDYEPIVREWIEDNQEFYESMTQ